MTTDGRDDGIDIHDPHFAADPWPVYRRSRDTGGCIRSDRYGGFWLLTRYPDVQRAARDWRTFTSSTVGVTAIPVITPRTAPQLPIELDPPEHSRYRAVLSAAFGRARIESLRPTIESLVDQLLQRMVAVGGGDIVRDFAEPVSVGTLAALMGLPNTDTDLWSAWIRRMFDVTDRADSATAAREFRAYIDDLINDRLEHPLDDLLTGLMIADVDGRTLSVDEVRSFVTVLFGAGFETTADALSILFQQLVERPDVLERLWTHPDRIEAAVEEVLRLGSPIQIFGRNATVDLELCGHPVSAGDVVALGFGSANRDPSVFTDPDVLDPEREPNPHLAFGAGVHLCLGAPLARLELASTLRAVVRDVGTLALRSDRDMRWKVRGDRRGLSSLEVTMRRRS